MIIDTGKLLRIVTNDLDAPAEEIADLYKQRWQIELFFRWVKQTLRIRRFIGVSENAVRIQIAVALIAFLILRLAQARSKNGPQPPRVRPARPRKPHAQTPDRPFARTATADPDKSKSVETRTILPMNRTAVGLSRPSTFLAPRTKKPNSSLPGLTHGCPVRFWWTGCMTWILLRFERLAHVRDTEGAHAMLHQNSVFHSLTEACALA